jgi:hypothetical protein
MAEEKAVDPLKGMLISGAVEAVLGFFDTTAEDVAKMDNDTKLRIAADMLGLDYAELSEKKRQYDGELKNRKFEFLKTYGLQEADLALRKDEVLKKYGLAAKELGLKQAVALQEMGARKVRQGEIAKFSGAFKRPTGRPVSPVKPGIAGPAPVGTTALRGAQEGAGIVPSQNTGNMSPMQHAGIV